MTVAPGVVIGSYRVEDAAGAGGMGQVFRATDTRLQRTVAIKFVGGALTDDARARFQREVRALASLNHPHIVTVHETGSWEGRDFIVTEFVDGGTLGAWARAEKRTWRQIVELLIGVADGLATAHGEGILHRDVKPDNVLVARNGYAKLADFGLAKQTTDAAAETIPVDSPTRRGVVLGTIDYMSPEQAKGLAVDARSDVFSFGVVLYELLSGRRPFSGDTELHVVDAILHQTPPPLGGDIPPALRATVEKALEKDPADRYQSMRDLVVDLRRVARQTMEGPVSALRQARPLRWRPVAALAVVALLGVGSAAWWRTRGDTAAATEPPIRSIAVIPLQNLSGDTNEEYFSDGMTEEVISRLAQVHALRVISRTSVMRYKSSDKRLPDIGRELGVDAIIEGSVRRSGGRVRVTAQLIRASTDTHMWARDFDHDAADVLKMQAEIADAIVREISAQVTPEESSRLSAARSVDPAAHDLYMLGRFHMWQSNRASWTQAISELEEAIRLQPDYAPAYATLSMTWGKGRTFNFTAEEGALHSAAKKALELDPTLAEAHSALAQVKFDDWDWDGAMSAFATAYRLNPNSIDVCGCYAVALTALGRFTDALRIAEEGIRVNPLSSEMRFNYGLVLNTARRYGEAEQQFARTLELEPQHVGARVFLALTYMMINRLPQALATLDMPAFQRSGTLGAIYARMGRRDEAEKVLARIAGASPFDMATVYVALGDKDRAIEWLTKAIDAHQGFVRWLNVSATFDSLHGDPRFDALIRRLKLPAPEALPATATK